MASLTVVELSCADMSVREINTVLRGLPDGSVVRISQPRGRHNLVVGISGRLDITIAGNAGYFIGGLCDGQSVTIAGFVGWSVGENLGSGTIRGHLRGREDPFAWFGCQG